MVNLNPQHIEEKSLNAWPARQTSIDDGWIIRFADGYTKRANSVTPLFRGNLSVAEKIDRCEALYNRQNQPPIFRLPSFHPESTAIDSILADRGYTMIDETSVQVADLEWAVHSESEQVRNVLYPAHWLPIYHRLNSERGDSDAHEQILTNILGETGYFVLMDEEHGNVACGLGVCEGPYLGLFDVVVDREHREKGYGSELMSALLAWGIERFQVKCAYLAVVVDNEPANKLYRRYGFRELYRYHYRVVNA